MRSFLIRTFLRRPLFILAILIVFTVLSGHYPGCSDPDGENYSAANGRRLYVSGIVKAREITTNGYRLILDHLSFSDHDTLLSDSHSTYDTSSDNLSQYDSSSSENLSKQDASPSVSVSKNNSASASEPSKNNVSTSNIMRSVVDELNHVISPSDRLQVFLSDGTDGTDSIYGEMEEEEQTGFWGNSAKPEDQTSLFEAVRIGDHISLYGKCTQPEKATNPGQFDSRRYYLARRIVLKMSGVQLRELRGEKFPEEHSDSASPVQADGASSVLLDGTSQDTDSGSIQNGLMWTPLHGLRYLYYGYRNLICDMRIGMQKGLLSVFGPGDASQAAAFVLGDGSGLDSAAKNLFRNGGLSWLVCVSSLHISLLGMMVFRILRSRGISFLLASAGSGFMVGSYALLTGFSISAQRAMITFIIWLGAQVFGRTRDALSSLSAAACVILIRQPFALWDSSFLMSVVCILSIEYLTPVISRILRPRKAMHRRFSSTLCLWLGSLPAVLWFFYQTSPYASMFYPIMLPLMSLFLGFGILGSVGGYLYVQSGLGIFLISGKTFAWPCRMMLAAMRFLCGMEQDLPGSVMILGRPALWQVILYYAALIVFAVWIKKMKPARFHKDHKDALSRAHLHDKEKTAGRKLTSQTRREGVLQKRSLLGRLSTEQSVLGNHMSGRELPNIGLAGQSILRRFFSERWMTISPLTRIRLVTAGLLIALVMMICFRVHPTFRYTCLDIGQGSCNLIEYKGCTYLYDAGSSSVKDVWQYRIGSALKYYGIRKVDTVFLSHGDMDHIDGIEQMLFQYHRNLIGHNAGDITIGRILVPDLATPDDRLSPILTKAAICGIETGCVSEGAGLKQDDMSLEILSPSPRRLTGESNEDCIVMMLRYQNLKILFTGDLEKEGEEMFVRAWKEKSVFSDRNTDIQNRDDKDGDNKDGQDRIDKEHQNHIYDDEQDRGKEDITILIAGHHGSKNATSREMLDLVKPDLVLISCGKNNRYGHPARAMLERVEEAGVPYRRTDLEGAIQVKY